MAQGADEDDARRGGGPVTPGSDGRGASREAGEETERPTAQPGRDSQGEDEEGPDVDYGEGEPRVGDADLRPNASAAPDTHAIRGFPPERQDRYPVAGGAVDAADVAAEAEAAQAAAHDPLGPGGYVEERDITGGPATALPERSSDPTHPPLEPPGDVLLEGPDAGPLLSEEELAARSVPDADFVEPAVATVPPLGEAVSRHRRGEEQESRVVLDATLGSRWLLPLTATLHGTRAWIRDTALALETNDPRVSWHALRAVLATLRDQLPVAEVADVASELPVVVRGAWYEGWSGRPAQADSRAAFIAAVEARLGPELPIDPEVAVRAVVTVLRTRVSAGEMRHIYAVLPRELKGMLAPV